jgi:hypothetical protein
MGNKNAQGRLSARRVATFLAALGVLVMSSGAALMVTAGSANATPEPKILVCKYVSTPGDSELKGGKNPIEVSLNTLKNVVSDAWLANPTFPKAWVDAQGQAGGGSVAIGYADEDLGISDCPGYGEQEDALDATASVTVTNPTCANENTPSYQVSGDHVSWDVLSEDVTPNGSVTVKFTANAQHAFADESTEKTITKNFGPAEEGCGEVSAPLTPSVSFTDPTCTAAGGFTGTNTDKVSYAVTSGSVAPGADVVVTATAKGNNKLTGQTAFPHKFATVPANCTTVSTPQVESSVVVSPPKAKTPKAKAHTSAATVTPTVVEAGLSTSAPDLRGEQGLALMFAGMVMLLAAGGLGLRVRGVAARI